MVTVAIRSGATMSDTRVRHLLQVLALSGSVCACGAAIAAAPAGKADSTDALRPAYAVSTDIADGKRLADGLCASCHGANGISTTQGVPHVAGQRPSYLYAKVRAYQSGARDDHAVESAVKFLNDDALVKVAAYYGSLEPAQPSGAGVTSKVETPPDALAAGKAAAAPCGGCHGETGISSTPGTPSLAGLDPKAFIAAMEAYKSGQRRHGVMQSLAAASGDADLKNLALHYATQSPARARTPAGGDVTAGKSASAACAACHGEQGVSSNPATPSLAGQDAQYLASAMRAYKDGARSEETMKLAASAVGARAIDDLAAYYAAQQPRRPKVEKPLTLAEWVQRCDRCHGINGNSIDPRTPALAGQRVEYLQKALQAYQRGQRRSSVMAAMSGTLADADVAALAAYYARQKARAFVFVMVPAK